MGECTSCGVTKLPLCLIKLTTDDLIQWQNIGFGVIGHIKEGKKAIKGEVPWGNAKKIDNLLENTLEIVCVTQFLSQMARCIVQGANGGHAQRICHFVCCVF